MAGTLPFSSQGYWASRYAEGGTSGAGSVGRLARFKAGFVNPFIADNAVRSLIDLGCGDTSQLALMDMPEHYVGVDVSPSALARCAARFPGRRFVPPEALRTVAQAEMTLSLDVIYHLTEDTAFIAAMRTLFAWATRFVVIYASNHESVWPSEHVRHRRFTDHVAATEPDWRLLAHVPNRYPFDPACLDDTSFADFFVYGRPSAACRIAIPAEN